MKFTDQVHFQNGSAIIFLQGKNSKEQEVFCYLRIVRVDYKRLLNAISSTTYIDFKSYGEVLLEGLKHPNIAQINYMKEQYGFEHSTK